MNSCEQFISRKRTNPILHNLNIVELIIDMMLNSTVKKKPQFITLSWTLCMKIKTLNLRVHQLISLSFWAN